jgi:hypothetical protein
VFPARGGIVSRRRAEPSDARQPAIALGLAAALAFPLLAGAAAAFAWTDGTAGAGIAYREAGEIHRLPEGHEVPDLSWPGFPEIMGGGACWVDVDNDGYDDLYVVNQRYNPTNPAWGPWADDEDTRNRLYFNNGDGTFADITDRSGADARAFGYGCSAADYDADGCMDLLATNFGPSYLYRGRCDGTFENATAALGVVGLEGACGDHACFSTSSGWADYDLDGDVDLYIGNYVDSSIDDGSRGPNAHVAQYNFLARNNGDGTFSEVAQQTGAAGYREDLNGSKTLGVAWLDYDRDGDPDLYAANDETPNNLFRNNGDGTFTELAPAALVADPRASMGLTAGDYDNDGWPDLFMTHYETEANGFYRNLHDGTFADRSGEDDQANSLNRTGWGTSFADVDRDGWLDIVLANGHTEWIADDYSQDIQVFLNEAEEAPSGAGDRQWTEVSGDVGLGYEAPTRVFRGLALADPDLDGDVDLFAVPNANQTALLLEGSGVANHWLYLQLRQPGANRQALGAVATVTAGGLTQVREHHPGHSYLSQNSMLLEVGLGAATGADVEVRWPDGTATALAGVPADRVVRVTKGVAGYVTDTLAPVPSAVLSGTGQLGWWRSTVAATVTAEDRAIGPATGVVGTQVAIDGGPWTDHDGLPVTFATEGVHALAMRSFDGAGNVAPRTVEIPIDLTPPTPAHGIEGTLGFGGWYLTEPVLSLASLDPLSGPGAIRYRVDAGAWTDYAGPFTLGEGVHDVDFVAADVAGNEAGAAFEVRVDTTPPTVAIANPAPGSIHLAGASASLLGAGPALIVVLDGAPFPLLADATDATSGVVAVRFDVDGSPVALDGAAPFEGSWDAASASAGLHLVEAFAVDAAGNAQRASVHVVLVAAQPSVAPNAVPDLLDGLPVPLLLVGAPLLARRSRAR